MKIKQENQMLLLKTLIISGVSLDNAFCTLGLINLFIEMKEKEKNELLSYFEKYK